ncbi:hypothetical protein, partial [Jannaschia helgolandensis]|uniref:hypothetical protein n=1 Tax=Jannaschia helgolandensis TaxID=188906 RepID=UPI0030D7FDA5
HLLRNQLEYVPAHRSLLIAVLRAAGFLARHSGRRGRRQRVERAEYRRPTPTPRAMIRAVVP